MAGSIARPPDDTPCLRRIAGAGCQHNGMPDDSDRYGKGGLPLTEE